jgi:hypothetical protein
MHEIIAHDQSLVAFGYHGQSTYFGENASQSLPKKV